MSDHYDLDTDFERGDTLYVLTFDDALTVAFGDFDHYQLSPEDIASLHAKFAEFLVDQIVIEDWFDAMIVAVRETGMMKECIELRKAYEGEEKE